MGRGKAWTLDPLEQLDLFAARVNELRDTRLMRSGYAPGMTLRWSEMEGLRLSTKEPDEEALRSFLLTFRVFTLENDPAYLGRIYAICDARLTSDRVRGYLRVSRQQWKEALKRQGVRLVVDGEHLTPEKVADWWINGHYFHSDPDKRRRLRELVDPASLMARQTFLHFLADATRQVLYVGNAVVVGLREGLFSRS